MANGEDLVEELLRDCFDYIDPATQGLLQYLIFNEYVVDIQAYIDHCITGYKEVISGDILRLEAAFAEDIRL